eukprot:TRINITY_DN10520_c0_g1_i1.p1 TRINITY_DN10520_c0_g1~~TRINITY_DN10520_c0_g1_i1.p1  ORF type:complete len:487 (-),score=124.15 TRINITY_DN10520_c0_g1_i1:107-1567(-)
MTTFFSFAILLFTLATSFGEDRKVIFAGAIVRSGANEMPNSKYFNVTAKSNYPKHPGELTAVGRHQLYLLARQLAHNYVRKEGLISSEYKVGELVVRSAGINKSVEAAQSFLTGFYQQGNGASLDYRLINEAVPGIEIEGLKDVLVELRDAAVPGYSIPFPVHTTNPKNDYLLNAHSICPAVLEEEKQYRGEFEGLDNKYRSFYKELKAVGIPVEKYEDVKQLSENVQSVLGNALELTRRLKDKDLDRLKEVVNKGDSDIFLRSERKRKLMYHTLLTELKDNLLNAKAYYGKGDNYTKMAYFQVDYYHILALSKLLRVDVNNGIPFASSLIFELVKTDKEYDVEVRYNGKEHQWNTTQGKGLSKFLELIKQNTFPNRQAFVDACFKYTINVTYNKRTYLIISLIMFFILLVIWGVSWFLVVRRRRRTGDNEDVLVEYLDTERNINASVLEPGLEKDEGANIKVAMPAVDPASDSKPGKAGGNCTKG